MSPPENKISPLEAPACRDEATSALRRPVTSLWGVGAERAAQLARLGILTIEDLLLHPPRRYEDRRHFRKIAELTKDEPATARGTIVALGLKRFRGGNKSVFEFISRRRLGAAALPLVEPAVHGKLFRVGDEVFVFGKLVETKPRTMDHPETEVIEGGEESFIHINRIAPVYPLTEGLPQRWLRGLIWRTLEKFESQIAEPQAGRVNPCGPFCRQMSGAHEDAPYHLPPRANAIRMIHFPEELTDVEIARRRLALDEFVELQLQIQSRRKKFRGEREGAAVRRRQPSDETVSGAARLQTDRRADECAARNPRGHGRPPSPGFGRQARIRCGDCCKATSAPAKPPWPPARR